MKSGGRVKKRGGGMSTARKDMSRYGYEVKDDMGMNLWTEAMMKKGGRVGKKNKVTKIEKMNLSL